MAHEITSSDGAVYNQQPAWHGLGLTVEEAMSPDEALKLSGLNWEVIKEVGVTSPGGAYSDNFCPIVRSDTEEILSIQSPDYEVFQNRDLFNMAYALGSEVKVESAFSIQGGKKIVCLLRGETFAPSNSREDSISKYMCLTSSHDGSIGVLGIPTSIRAVCANTLNMVLRSASKNRIRFTHTGNVKAKENEMRRALTQYIEIGRAYQDNVNVLSSKILTTQEIQEFWLKVYGELEKPVDPTDTSEAGYENQIKAASRIAKWAMTFDKERSTLQAPPSLWQAVNAVTAEVQHRIPSRGRKPSRENSAYSNLIGTNQTTSLQVVDIALSSLV